MPTLEKVCSSGGAVGAEYASEPLGYNNNQRRTVRAYNFSDLANSTEIEEKPEEFGQMVGRLLQCMIEKQVGENLDRYFKEISLNFEKINLFEPKKTEAVHLGQIKDVWNRF